VRQADVTSPLKDIENRNPVFAARLHAHIAAVVGGEPSGKPTQISRKRGETAYLMGSVITLIGCSYTSYEKIFVDVHSTAYGVHNVNCSCQ